MLLAGGDSFTWGNELPDCDESRCSRLSWSALLAEREGLSYRCVAEGGASNQTIARRLMTELCRVPIPRHVQVMWTFPVRHELLHRYDHSVRLSKKHTNVSPWHAQEEKDDLLKQYAESMISLASHEYHEQQSLFAICTLTSFLRHNGISFTYSATTQQIYDMLEKNPHLDKLIGKHVWYRRGKGFYDWSKENGYEMSELGHPVAQAHLDWIS